MTFKEIFVVFHTPPFHKLFTGLHADENPGILEWLRVGFRIVPRDLIFQMVSIDVT